MSAVQINRITEYPAPEDPAVQSTAILAVKEGNLLLQTVFVLLV